jgi:hypothetical protein
VRKIKCKEVHGISVEEVLDEFNERRQEFGVKDADVISVSVRAADKPTNIHTTGGPKQSTVIVTIFYWSDGK